MVVTCSFAGCAGFSIDKVKYYNEVVALVDDAKITRYDLLSAYNSYGKNYYVSQQNQSVEDAMNSTLDLLIDREVLYRYAKDNETYAITPYQVNSIVESIFESVDNQMDTYIKTAKKKLNLKVEDENTTTSNDTEKHPLSSYTYSKRAKLVETSVEGSSNLEYTIKYEYEEEPEVFDELIERKYLNDYSLAGTVQAIIDEYLKNLKDSLSEEDKATDIYDEAIDLLADDLIDYEYYLRDDNNKPYNTVTDDLIYRYFNRMFNDKIKSQYLTNIRIDYLRYKESLSLDLLTEKYNVLVTANKNKYLNHPETYAKDMKDIGTKADTMLYHPDLSNDTKFGYFAHTLLSFSESQKNRIKELEKSKDLGNLTEDEYNRQLNSIYAETTVKVRDLEGNELDQEPISYSDLITGEYADILKISNPETRLNKFIEFMFKYTGDTATLSAGMPYVVGTDGYSAMEEAFTDEAVRLIETNKADSMTPASTENMVVTSYGIHLLYYIGDVRDTRYSIPYTDIGSIYFQTNDKAEDEGRNNLYTKLINPLTKQTYFDMLFDKVYPANNTEEVYTSKTGYSDYENDIVDTHKNKTYKVTKYSTKIKSTKPNI